MFDLWLGITVLLVIAGILIFLPMFVSLRGSELKRKDSNLTIYKAQLAELEEDFRNGRIEQAEHDSLSQEIKLNLLADTQEEQIKSNESKGNWVIIPSVLLLVIISISLYAYLGAENELAIAHALKNSNSADFTKEDVAELIQRLEQQTKDTPDDVEMWYLLGRLNFDLGNYDQAVVGFTSVLQLLPVDATEDQAVAMSQLAQAQFFANGRKLDAATKSLLNDVLSVNPTDETALGLLGVSAFDNQQYVEAVGYWQKLISMMPASNPNVSAIQGGINTALERMTPEQREGVKKAQAAIQPAVISVTVDIADDIKSFVPSTADVFVLAKAETGPPMPLAVQRLSVTQWPITVTLDDSMAMMPALKLSQFENVVITARISKSGVGNATAGDIQGSSQVISSQVKSAKVTISEVIK